MVVDKALASVNTSIYSVSVVRTYKTTSRIQAIDNNDDTEIPKLMKLIKKLFANERKKWREFITHVNRTIEKGN